MTVPLSPKDLYQQVRELPLGLALVELADAQWALDPQRPATPHDAETCRLAMLAVLQTEPLDRPRADLWRSRALVRFAQAQWTEGVAAMVMGEAFRALGAANDDYPDGKTLDHIRPSTEALDILAELEPFAKGPGSGVTVGPRSPSPDLIARFVHEKRGFLLLVANRLDDARASYQRAATIVGEGSRGEIKVRLGLALVDYAASVKSRGDGSSAASETAELVEIARRTGQDDLVRDGTFNVNVMRGHGFALKPYEIL